MQFIYANFCHFQPINDFYLNNLNHVSNEKKGIIIFGQHLEIPAIVIQSDGAKNDLANLRQDHAPYQRKLELRTT